MPDTTFDLVVIGGGPGGYACAIRAAQNGLKVACIEKWEEAGEVSFGGTCLQVGCIPSKALLESSWLFHKAKTGGISGLPAEAVAAVSPDIAAVMGSKTAVVEKLTGGVKQLLKGNKVTAFHGHGRLLGAGQVEFTPSQQTSDATLRFSAKAITLAGGSLPMALPALQVDHEFILDSTDALSLSSPPKRLAVIGAGAVGLELGSVWSRYGSEVTVIEALQHFLPSLDPDLSRLAKASFIRQGLGIRLGSTIESATLRDGAVCLRVGEEELVFDKAIIAVGRRPNSDAFRCDGLVVDKRGFIKVNVHCETSLENVYAIGDLVRGPMLAHKAIHEGVMVADRLIGEPVEVDLGMIPAVIYTHPEIAWVGLNSEQARKQEEKIHSGRFAFAANGRALASGEDEGAVKVITDSQHRILGLQAVGLSAAEIVQQGLIAMEFGGSAEDLAEICFAHPTVSEVLHESALSALGRALHAVNKR